MKRMTSLIGAPVEKQFEAFQANIVPASAYTGRKGDGPQIISVRCSRPAISLAQCGNFLVLRGGHSCRIFTRAFFRLSRRAVRWPDRRLDDWLNYCLNNCPGAPGLCGLVCRAVSKAN